MNKPEAADKAIANYDAILFQSVGKSGMSDKLNSLAEAAYEACKAASCDRSVNQATRNHFKPLADFFKTQVLA